MPKRVALQLVAITLTKVSTR